MKASCATTVTVFLLVSLTGCLLQLENPQVGLETAPAYNDARISIPFYATGVASPARVVWELEYYDTVAATWEDAGSERLQVPTDTYGSLELGELPEARYRLHVELLGSRANDDDVALQRIRHDFYVDRIAPNVSDITALSTTPSLNASDTVYLEVTLNDTSNPDFESPHRVLGTSGISGFLIPDVHELENNRFLLWTAGEYTTGDIVTVYLLVIDEAGNRSDLRIENYTTQ